jgi:hypothetical protein
MLRGAGKSIAASNEGLRLDRVTRKGFDESQDSWRSHDPSVTRSLPFPGVVPGHGGGIAFRPGHDNGITLARRASESLPQISETAASVFAFE